MILFNPSGGRDIGGPAVGLGECNWWYCFP